MQLELCMFFTLIKKKGTDETALLFDTFHNIVW